MKKGNEIICCSSKEKVRIFLKGIVLLSAVGILFYNSWISILIGSPILILYYRFEYRKLVKKKTEELTDHFKEALLSILSALKAGYSVENAFVEAYRDLEYRFGAEKVMVKELLFINRQVKNNIPIERLIEDFGQKSGSADIKDFAHIFRIAKKSGGDMGKIMDRTISIISRRMEMQEEIRMMVTAKKYEQQIMNFVPLGIILYIRVTNQGYFDPLYHNPAGIVIVTAALAVYLGAYYLSERILEIA
ncbi:MAG: type II secretion system F family protein [Lachnospiraceae bacterium]|nr:type II secretion system F family protein [Lachnospiraceae bacterium]